MPTSQWRAISDVLDLLMAIQPRPSKILDIGIGFGKYGFLAREYLSYWGNRHHESNAFQVRIDGVEAFPGYINELQKMIYDEIYLGAAQDILPGFSDQLYDLIFLIDVLEHFPPDVGIKLLKECLRVAQMTFVSTPIEFEAQQDAFGNPYERHQSLWNKHMLASTGAIYTRNSHDCNWLAVFSRDQDISRQLKIYARLNSTGRRLIRLCIPYTVRHRLGMMADSIFYR